MCLTVFKMNLVRIGCYFYSHNLAAIKMVTQSHKAEAIRFYDYCLTNANLIFFYFQNIHESISTAKYCKFERKRENDPGLSIKIKVMTETVVMKPQA